MSHPPTPYKEYWKWTIKQISRARLNYALACSSIFLVVAVVALSLSVLAEAPVVFLALAEANLGQTDLEITVGEWTGKRQLNYTALDLLARQTPPLPSGVGPTALPNADAFKYTAPRISLDDVEVVSGMGCTEDPVPNTWMYSSSCGTVEGANCVTDACSTPPLAASLYISDTEREIRAGITPNWPHSPLKHLHAHVQEELASALNVKKGDVIIIRLPVGNDNFLRDQIELGEADAADGCCGSTSGASPFTPAFVPFTIAGTYPLGGYGRQPNSVNNGIFIEYEHFVQAILDRGHPNMHSGLRWRLERTDPYTVSQSVIMNLPPRRADWYIEQNYDDIATNVIGFAEQVLYRLGFYSLRINLPVLRALSFLQFFSLFLSLTLNTIVTILTGLSILLVYSLLMVNVETRTFEMGIFRMMGMTRKGVVILLLMQSFAYSLPAWFFGLIAAEIGMISASIGFQAATEISLRPFLSAGGIGTATVLGLAIPVVASILPIRKALALNLHDSLDVSRTKNQAVKVTIERDDSGRLGWPVLAVGGFMAIFGFLIYYLFPLALLSFNLGLLLNVFFGLLIGMLIGLVLLSLNLQNVLERIAILLFFFWEREAMRDVLRKNLVAHRPRNRKTSIMYAISLGFIIFVVVSAEITVASVLYGAQQDTGAFLAVDATNNELKGIKRDELEAVVLAQKKIKSFAWLTRSLDEIRDDVGQTQMGNIGRVFWENVRLRGASPNLFSTAIPGYLQVSMEPNLLTGGLDEELYTMWGSFSALVGTKFNDSLHLALSDPFLLALEAPREQGGGQLIRHRLKPLAFVDTAPALDFSKYPTFGTQDLVVSLNAFARLANLTSVDDVPMSSMLLELDDMSDDELDGVVRKLEDSVDGISVVDYRQVARPLAIAVIVLNTFFNFSTAVAMTVSFFSLVSSMYTNVYESTREIGILRAIGMKRMLVTRLYVYEAFVLVVASSGLGMMIGSVVAWTMTLQRQLFTQLPLNFVFPWGTLWVVLVLGVVFAWLTALPTRAIISKKIVDLMRTII